MRLEEFAFYLGLPRRFRVSPTRSVAVLAVPEQFVWTICVKSLKGTVQWCSPQYRQNSQRRAPFPECSRSGPVWSRLVNRKYDAVQICTFRIRLSMCTLHIIMANNFPSEKALLDLSSHVRTLYIGRWYDRMSDTLFNIEPTEWRRIVLKMFSGKLEALYLHNQRSPEYISDQSLLTLVKVRYSKIRYCFGYQMRKNSSCTFSFGLSKLLLCKTWKSTLLIYLNLEIAPNRHESVVPSNMWWRYSY